MSILDGTSRVQRFEAFIAQTDAIDIICDRIAEHGERIGQIAQSLDIPSRRLRLWIMADPERMDMYRNAVGMLQDDRVQAAHDNLMAVKDNKDAADIRAKQLKGSLDVAKHWMPERYGDKIKTEHSGSVSMHISKDEAGL